VREKAVLVASGLSAAYAIQAAVDHPGQVRALALVSPLGLGETAETGALQGFAGRVVGLPVVGAPVLDLLTGRAALAAYLRGDLWRDVSEDLDRLRVPVWLAWGRQAKNPPVDQADLWLRHLSGAALDVFEGAGALPYAEAPTLFCRALERFLERTRTSTD